MFRKMIGHLSIRSIILISFIPMVLLILFTYYGFYKVGSSQLERQTYNSAVNVNTQISSSLEQTLENVYQTASAVTSSLYFFNMKKNIESNQYPVVSPSNYYRLSQLLDNLIASNPDYFHSVSLFLDNRSIFVYRTEIVEPVVKVDFRYEDYADTVSNRILTWVLPQDVHPYQLISGNYSSLGMMMLLGTPESDLHGFLLFEINDSLLEKEIKNAIITPDSRFYILSGSRPLISGSKAETEPPPLPEHVVWNGTEDTAQFRNSTDAFFYTPVSSPASSVELGILSHVSLKEIQLNQRPLTFTLLFIILLLSAICALSYFLIYTTISRPFHRLNRMLTRHSVLSDHAQFAVNGCAEITTINQTLNQYVSRTRQLVDDLNHEMDERRIAELNILYEQINPHFLYNALDTIYQLCELEDLQKAKEMTASLATFYRIGVSKGANHIRLEEEFSHAVGFLTVMEIRFEDFTYEIDLPDELRSYYTIKQILQPILENAIYHGIHPLHDRLGHIGISAAQTEQGIQIEIRDNGVGIEDQPLEEIRNDLDTHFDTALLSAEGKKSGKLYGLKNVHKRIRLTFGSPYGVTIASEPEQGTVVTLLIPKLTSALYP